MDHTGISFRQGILFVESNIRRAARKAPWLPVLILVVVMFLMGKAMRPTAGVVVPTAEGPRRVCSQNPYAGGLTDPLTTVAARADAWLNNLEALQTRARTDVTLTNHDHSRFFPFDTNMTTCTSLDCVGGPCKTDESKIVCAIDQLRKEDTCIIYSIGGNNQWNFELDVLQKTPCQIHTFDCTGPAGRFQKPNNDRLHFHYVCLGPVSEPASSYCQGDMKCGETWTLLEMQEKLGHDRIDLLKLDIEGFEWGLLESWPLLQDTAKAKETILPMQLLVEVHYQSQFKELSAVIDADFKFAPEIVNFQARLLQMGYVVVERDDNAMCPHCTELTLVRYRCPSSGAYAQHFQP